MSVPDPPKNLTPRPFFALQYYFTLGTSIAGGLVAGFVSKLEPGGGWGWPLLVIDVNTEWCVCVSSCVMLMGGGGNIQWSRGNCVLCCNAGFVQRRWVWLLIFSPLWGSLFINFGLGPIVSRTDDKGPIIANTAAFLATAFVPWAATAFLREAPPPKAD